MRARERERVAEQARELCADVDRTTAAHLTVIWARVLPDAYGLAVVHRPTHGTRVEDSLRLADVILCETRWTTSLPAERADTIAHELAHLIAWCRDPDALPHGDVWKSLYRRLLSAANEMDW